MYSLPEAIEFIRERPAMFVRTTRDFSGISVLLCGLIDDCVNVCKFSNPLFTLSIDAEFISLTVSSADDVSIFLDCFMPAYYKDDSVLFLENYSVKFASVLMALTKELIIQDSSGVVNFNREQLLSGTALAEYGYLRDIKMSFVLDDEIFSKTEVDFEQLGEKLSLYALVNRQTEILLKDTRKKYLLQNYYHYPEGVFYLHKRHMAEVLRTSDFNIFIDEQIGENKYQIALSYRADWWPDSAILDFCNNRQLGDWWPLTNGAVKGITSACKKYAKQNGLIKHKITKSSINKQLILVCAMRSSTYDYRGTEDEKADDARITREVTHLVAERVSAFFEANSKFTADWFGRFNEPQSFIDRLNLLTQQEKEKQEAEPTVDN